MSNTGIPKVNVAASASSDGQPEVDVSDEEFLQFDTSGVPVVVTLTKVTLSILSQMGHGKYLWRLYVVHVDFVGGKTLYCGCDIRRGIPDELCYLCFYKQARAHMWAD